MAENQKAAVLKTLHSLRTIHGTFSDTPIADSDMQEIVNAAVRAPNSSGRQCYSIIRLEGKPRVKEVCSYPAPQALLFLSDHTRLNDEARRRGNPVFRPNMADLLTTTIDASVAAQNAIIAARAMNIDSLLTNSPIRLGDPLILAESLDIPSEGCMPLFAVLFCYPKTEPDHLQGRYCGPGLLHHDKYHRMTEAELQAMSEEYDRPHMGLVFGKNWKEKSYTSYFDWFFNSWMPNPDEQNSRIEEDRALRLAQRAGFLK